MITHTLQLDNRCVVCGVPVDAEIFDVSGFIGQPAFETLPKKKEQMDMDATTTKQEQMESETCWQQWCDQKSLVPPIPRRGEQQVLATFQLHNQYCGAITYFSQYTDLYARNNAQIQTPGFEWQIFQNGKPVFPYTKLEMIVNPWGYNCLPVFIRLDENARVEFVIRNRSVKDDMLECYPIKAFAGRIMGRYWYNDIFGKRIRS